MDLPAESPALSANKSFGGKKECVSCGDGIGGGSLSLTCPSHHSLCLTCTAIYTNHSCQQAAAASPGPNAANYLPLQCSITQCALPLPSHTLAIVIPASEQSSPEYKGLWAKYEKLVVMQALAMANAEKKDEEVLLTCPKCGDYTEMFVPPSPDFWKKIDIAVNLSLEELEIKEAEELRKRILAVEKKSQDTLTVKWGKWYASNQNRESLAKAKLKNLFQQEWKSQAEEEATQKCKEVLSLIATKEQEKVEQAGSILKELLPDLVPNDAPHSQRVDKIVSFTLEALVEKVFQYCGDQFTKARLADQLAEERDEIDAEFKLAQEEEQRILKEQLKKFQAEFAETMKRHKAELTRTKDWKEFAKENTNKALLQ
jgi:hypothetical protein